MQKSGSFFVFLISFAFSLYGQRSVESFNNGWDFLREEGNWEKVTLPHTARLESKVVVSQFQGDCVYRKSFSCHLKKNEKAFLYF